MQTTLQTLAPESESGEAGSAFELWPPSRTESNSSPSNVPVSNDPSPLQRPPSYRPPSLRQNEQPFVWAARATQPLSNSTHSRQQHTFADEMPYRSPTHMASLPISIPVPPPYREPTTTEPTSSTSHILSNATTSDIGLPNGIARARLPEVAGAAHSALGLDAAPPEYSPTPAPAEQPDIDSADSLPLAPPPPIVAAETFPISTPYETYSYGIRGSIPTGRGSRADATVIPIVAWRNGVQPPNTVLPAITILCGIGSMLCGFVFCGITAVLIGIAACRINPNTLERRTQRTNMSIAGIVVAVIGICSGAIVIAIIMFFVLR